MRERNFSVAFGDIIKAINKGGRAAKMPRDKTLSVKKMTIVVTGYTWEPHIRCKAQQVPIPLTKP